MPIDFRRLRATFPTHSGSAQTRELTFVFPTNVRNAEAAINGFDYGFTSSDRELFRTQIDTTVTSISANAVRVTVNFALRDRSGFFDDPYDGFVDVLAIVDRV